MENLWYGELKMLNGQQIKQIQDNGYKYLCIFQDNEIKTQVLKDHNRIFEDSKKVCEIGIVSKKCVCLWG